MMLGRHIPRVVPGCRLFKRNTRRSDVMKENEVCTDSHIGYCATTPSPSPSLFSLTAADARTWLSNSALRRRRIFDGICGPYDKTARTGTRAGS